MIGWRYMRRLLTAVGALAAISLVAGCASTPTEEARPLADVINVVLMSEPPNFDPHATSVDTSRAASRQIFETLVTLNANREVTPMLAETIEETDDGSTIVFTLREGVLFHDGTELTAEDAAASLTRWATFSSVPDVVKKAEFVATDDLTVEMRMAHSSVLALPALAKSTQFSAIMPAEIAEAAGAEPITEYVGTGPYQFSELKPNQYVELSAFEDYVSREDETSGLAGRKEALTQTVRMHFVSDPATQLAGVQTGEYDIVHNMATEYYDRVADDPNLEAGIVDFGAHIVLYNRNPESIFNDVKIRQAVNVGIKADEIEKTVFGDEAFVEMDSGYATTDDAVWHSNAGSENYNVGDVERAKELLAETSYAGEEVVLLVSQEQKAAHDTSLMLVEQLKAIGINAKLDVYDQATVLDRRKDPNNWDLYVAIYAWADTPLGMTFMNPSFFGGPFDEKTLALRAEVGEAASLDEAREAWQEMQEYLWEYLVGTKLGNKKMLIVERTAVEGLTDLDGLILWNTTVTE